MKNRDYTDLRNKTIFDFCTDEDVLDDLVGITDKEEYLILYHTVRLHVG